MDREPKYRTTESFVFLFLFLLNLLFSSSIFFFFGHPLWHRAFLVVQTVTNLPTMQETWV